MPYLEFLILHSLKGLGVAFALKPFVSLSQANSSHWEQDLAFSSQRTGGYDSLDQWVSRSPRQPPHRTCSA